MTLSAQKHRLISVYNNGNGQRLCFGPFCCHSYFNSSTGCWTHPCPSHQKGQRSHIVLFCSPSSSFPDLLGSLSTFVKMLLWYLTLALSLTSRWTRCFFHPCSALKMTPFLSVTDHNILIHPLISSCLDYCTSLYAGPVGPLCPVSSLVAGLLMENSEWALVSSCLSTNAFMVWLLTTSTQRDVFTPKLWNRIPLTARSAPSLNLLKLLLKLIFTHWVLAPV